MDENMEECLLPFSLFNEGFSSEACLRVEYLPLIEGGTTLLANVWLEKRLEPITTSEYFLNDLIGAFLAPTTLLFTAITELVGLVLGWITGEAVTFVKLLLLLLLLL